MAEPIKVISSFRRDAAEVVENLRGVDALLATIEDHGTNDAERLAFLAGMFGEGNPYPDMSEAEFAAAINALRDIRAQWEISKYAVAKLL